jgi:hypothetical protein
MNKINTLLTVLLITGCTSIQKNNYTYRLSEKYGQAVFIFNGNKLIGSIRPEYRKEISDISEFKNEKTVIEPVYKNCLADRGRKPQPRPFEDVNGDGMPDFICIERQSGLTNASLRAGILRFFTVYPDGIEETGSVISGFGEMLHFDDFNGDGIPEIVNTDNERHFLYSAAGYPVSSQVWIYDRKSKKYWNAAEMIEVKTP